MKVNREPLESLKHKSKFGIRIGIIIAVFSSVIYVVTDHKLTTLDKGKLDEKFVD